MRHMKWLAAAGLLLTSLAAPGQTITSFTATPSSGNSPLTFTLAWNATGPAGTTCTASDGWSGVKALSGSQVISNLAATTSYTLTCSDPNGGGATLTWTAPTTNTDGSPLTNLAGYKLFHAPTSAGVDTASPVSVPLGTTFTLTGLPAGTRWFGMKAFNSLGAESVMSTKTSKVINVSSDARTVTVTVNTVPNPPVIVTVTSVAYDFKGGSIKVVGSVPTGTACDALQFSKNGFDYYLLPQGSYTLNPGAKPRSPVVGVCEAQA